MNPTTCDDKMERRRFEDSYSLPQNQRTCPDDEYALEHEKDILAKWHLRNDSEALEKIIKKGL